MMRNHCWIILMAGLLTSCAVKIKPIDFDRNAFVENHHIDEIIKNQAPVEGPISLYDAMARALKYNLDQKIEYAQQEYREKQVALDRIGMFPNAIINIARTSRNNDSGSSSRSLITGEQSLQTSTSSERQTNTGDLSVSWDILDFGFAYIQSKQDLDEQMIAEERRRKVTTRILEDVRTAYWRAVSADRTHRKLAKLEALAQKSLYQAEQLENRRQVSPIKVLNFQRDLLRIQSNVQRMQRELILAKNQLAALMNMRPNTRFSLQLPDRTDIVPELPGSAEQMILLGLKYRPELRESTYRERINREEINKQLVASLPSVKAILGLNYDSNNYLYNNQWVTGSAQISWNLMNVFRYPRQKAVLKAEGKVIKAQEHALAMAIMTQVYIARARFIRLSHELNTIRRGYDVQERILQLTEAGYRVKQISQQELIRERMNSILEEVRYDTAYADLQNAYANLYASMGIDSFSLKITPKTKLSNISRALKQYWTEDMLVLPNMKPPKIIETDEHHDHNQTGQEEDN